MCVCVCVALCVVVEVYTSYWGPCACVFNKLQSIYKDYMDRPIKLACVSAAHADRLPSAPRLSPAVWSWV